MASFESSLGRDDLLAAMEALVPTDEAGWEAHFDTLPYPTAG